MVTVSINLLLQQYSFLDSVATECNVNILNSDNYQLAYQILKQLYTDLKQFVDSVRHVGTSVFKQTSIFGGYQGLFSQI